MSNLQESTPPFELYTVQVYKKKLADELGIPTLDTTVKTGDPAFAPSWDIVMRHKQRTLTDKGYTQVYKQMMALSYRENTARWISLINQPSVCIMCYCPACTQEKYVFCHRYVLVRMLDKICQRNGRAFQYNGEITAGGLVRPILPGL